MTRNVAGCLAAAGWLLLDVGSAVAQQPSLVPDEVERIVAQAAAEAQRLGLAAQIAVTDQEGNILARFRMDGAREDTVVRPLPDDPGVYGEGLVGVSLPASFAAVTKAGTAAFLSTGGHAFSTRTASFIIQDHFPPLVEFTPGGPLFGVQFSSLPCSDFKAPLLPAGLAGDPGGLPLYKEGRVVGGIGVEGDGIYTVDPDPTDADLSPEELAALAGARGFEPPDGIQADFILADGIRLPYANGVPGQATSPGAGSYLEGPRGTQPRAFTPVTVGTFQGAADPRFPVRAGSVLSAEDVTTILEQGARQAERTRAAIRRPLGSAAQITVVVVDVDGSPLGNLRTLDAPVFGFDVAAQKARTAVFFSGAGAAEDLRAAGLAFYLDSEVPLDGSVAYSTRAVGFMAQPFFPPGIPDTDAGPLSVPRAEWSPFNTGLQLDVVRDKLDEFLATLEPPGTCSAAIPRLKNGITIFPGGVPLYKDGHLAGAVGVSGDGVDPDDLIASAGSAGYEAPPEIRCDRLSVRGVRLPWVKFPRHPDL